MSDLDYRATAGFGATLYAPAVEGGERSICHKRISFVDYPMGSADVMYVMKMPALTHIHSVSLYVVTGEGATATVDVGSYSDVAAGVTDGQADGWLNNANIETAGVAISSGVNGATWGLVTGKFHAGIMYLGILANNALDAAVIDLWVDMTVYKALDIAT